jgi:hypothetical protein
MQTAKRSVGGESLLRAIVLTSATACLSLGSLVVAGTAYAQSARPAIVRLPSTSPADRLNQIAAAAKAASKETFRLTYTSSGSGSSSKVTLEQKPPKQLFLSGTGEVLFDGKKTYYCSTDSSAPTCIIYSSAGASPLAGMMEVYSATPYLTVMQGWQEIIAARLAGFRISFSNAKFAGQPSTCVTWSYHGSSAKYCVTNKGILAYVGGSGSGSSSSFELTAFSTHVRDSDFKLPRGAKITSIP